MSSGASEAGGLRRNAPALAAAVPVTILFVAVLSIVLTGAGPKGLRLDPAHTSSWIVALYGIPAIPSVLLSIRYRQPLLLTGNVFAIIFFASLGHQLGFAELSGASLIAGAVVVVAAALGLTKHLAAWIPAPIVQGLIAGAVMPFVIDIFSGLSTADPAGAPLNGDIPVMVGAALVAYLLSRRFLGPRVPPILPALAAGLVAAGVTGSFGALPAAVQLADLTFTRPEFSPAAVATVMPIIVALITLQSNLPSVVYMRSQGYEPPERMLDVVSGVGTMLASFLGPNALSLALPLVPLTSGPGAGEQAIRYRSVYLPAVALLVIALLSGTASAVAVLVPPPLLLALAGLALIGVLAAALHEITRGPLVLGPLFAFVIALSKMTLFGLSQFFWSLVLGVAVSLLLERDEWKRSNVAMREGGAG